jgi:dUTPase
MRIPFYVHDGIVVIHPNKGNPFNAGIDFYIPYNGIIEINPGNKDLQSGTVLMENEYVKHQFSPHFKSLTLLPFQNALIHSGISIEVDFSQMGMVCNRSGIASRYNCIVGASIIDTFYTGEICFDIHNIGQNAIMLTGHMKIAQLVFIQYISATPFNISKHSNLYEDMVITGDIRGVNGFGSSGI